MVGSCLFVWAFFVFVYLLVWRVGLACWFVCLLCWRGCCLLFLLLFVSFVWRGFICLFSYFGVVVCLFRFHLFVLAWLFVFGVAFLALFFCLFVLAWLFACVV